MHRFGMEDSYTMETKRNHGRKSRVRMTAAAVLAAIVVSTMGATLSPTASVEVEASSVYTVGATSWTSDLTGDTTRYVGYASLSLVLKASLMKCTDPDAVYEQLMMGLWMKTFSEADILDLINDGYEIPAETLERLYLEGWISGYLYKTGTGQSYTASDFEDVFDYEYYVAANPLIAEAVANGSLAYDEETLFLHWLVCGVPAGLDGSADFSFDYFEARYPTLCASLGYDKLSEVVYYIMLRDTYVLQGAA